MSDDHATQAFGSYGSRLADIAPTPRLDALARQGARLTRAFVTNSICTPSRASILTGQYSHRNGVYQLNEPLDPTLPNVAKELRNAGYTTAIIGKWHLRSDPSGFDYWQILPGQGRYFDPEMLEIGGNQYVHEGYSADVITDLSLHWLEEMRDEDRPFSLMVHFKAVHEPFEYASRHAPLYEDVKIPEPQSLWEDKSHRSSGSREYGFTIEDMAGRLVQREQWQPERPLEEMSSRERLRHGYQAFMKHYLRTVAGIDDNVGRLLDYLEDAGLVENTIVVYTSDQGYFLGEHNYIDKRWMYEESIRMPFLIRYPGEIQPGTVVDDIVLNIDFAPTLLDFAGLETPGYMQGRSFRRNLNGERPPDWRQAMYYRYWMHGSGARRPAHYGIRTDRFKLVFFYGLPLGHTENEPTEPGWELYDLVKDPHELDNVYDDEAYAHIVWELKARLRALKQEFGDDDERYPQLQELHRQLR